MTLAGPICFTQCCSDKAWYLIPRSVKPQPWHFTSNRQGLPHAHSLSVCLFLWVCVVCVWFCLYLSFYLCYAACFLFWSIFITTFLFSFFVFYKFNRHLCHGAYWCTNKLAHMPILLSFCISICVIHACVYVNLYTHLPPLQYSYTFIAIFTCIHVSTIL